MLHEQNIYHKDTTINKSTVNLCKNDQVRLRNENRKMQIIKKQGEIKKDNTADAIYSSLPVITYSGAA